MLLVSSLNDVFAQKNDNFEMETSDDDQSNSRIVLALVYGRDDSTESIGTPQTKSRDFAALYLGKHWPHLRMQKL